MGQGTFAKLDLKPRGLLKDSRPPSPMKHLGLVNQTVSALLANLLEKLSSLASCIPGCWYARNSLDKQAEKSCLYSEYANKTSRICSFLSTHTATKLPFVLIVCCVVVAS